MLKALKIQLCTYSVHHKKRPNKCNRTNIIKYSRGNGDESTVNIEI